MRNCVSNENVKKLESFLKKGVLPIKKVRVRPDNAARAVQKFQKIFRENLVWIGGKNKFYKTKLFGYFIFIKGHTNSGKEVWYWYVKDPTGEVVGSGTEWGHKEITAKDAAIDFVALYSEQNRSTFTIDNFKSVI